MAKAGPNRLLPGTAVLLLVSFAAAYVAVPSRYFYVLSHFQFVVASILFTTLKPLSWGCHVRMQESTFSRTIFSLPVLPEYIAPSGSGSRPYRPDEHGSIPTAWPRRLLLLQRLPVCRALDHHRPRDHAARACLPTGVLCCRTRQCGPLDVRLAMGVVVLIDRTLLFRLASYGVVEAGAFSNLPVGAHRARRARTADTCDPRRPARRSRFCSILLEQPRI